jgi:hypothetical protein
MKPKMSFKDRVGADNEREKSRGSSGHLAIPRDITMLKVAGGDKVKFDFLPYVVSDENHPCRNDEKGVATPGDVWYRRPYRMHRNIGVNNSVIVCPTSVEKKCPVCEYRSKLLKQGKQFDDEEVKAVKPSERNLYAVVPIGHKEYEEEVHLFDISRRCFQDKLREETDEKPEFRAFFDPSEDGFTVAIRFSEEQLGKNKFADASRIDFEPRKEGYDDKFLEGVPDLDKILIIHPYEKIRQMFYGAGKEADEVDDDDPPFDADAAPARRGKTESRSRRDEKEEEEDDKPARRVKKEEDEDEPPKKTKKPADDDEDEPPVKSKRATKNDDEDEPPAKSKKLSDDEDEPPKKSSRKDDDACVACDGSGENSKGRVCAPCHGTGKKAEKEEDEDDKPTEKSGKESTRKSKDECPSGHKFGVDTDKKDECDACKVWEACYDVKKAARKAGK